MEEPAVYEKYPLSTVALFQFVSLLNYAAGLYILFLVHNVLAPLFLLYLLALEMSVYREGCVSCWYYGKRCASGRGSIVPKLFKRADPDRFCEKEVTWKNLLPSVLVTAVPVLAGTYLLTRGFSWPVLALMMVPVATWFLANPLIYGKLSCPHCRQCRICCPANEFFGKKVEEKNV